MLSVTRLASSIAIAYSTTQFVELVLFTLLGLATPTQVTAAVGSSRETAPNVWRRMENDGINSLFLQLRCLGYNRPFKDYLEQIREDLPCRDLLSLATIAGKLGYSLVPARLTVAELEKSQHPTTIHLEQTGLSTGYYVLVLDFDNKGDLHVVHGGKATFEIIPRDSFRRQWDGYALVPTKPHSWSSTIRDALFGVLIAWIAASALGRFTTRKKQC